MKNKTTQEEINDLINMLTDNMYKLSGINPIWTETIEQKIIRLEKEIEEKQKELHQLKFSDKFNGMINDK